MIFTKTNQPLRGGLLLKELLKIREHKCEECGCTTWLEKPITLEAHHIDGDKTNNELSNLLLLCPNCHSYTDNFGSKNIKKQIISDEVLLQALIEQPSIRQALLSVGLTDGSVNYKRAKKLMLNYNENIPEKTYKTDLRFCIDCGKEIYYQSIRCRECANKQQQTVMRPSREELKSLVRIYSFVDLGKQFKVSDKTISKWCKTYNLPDKKRQINSYTDEEWLLI